MLSHLRVQTHQASAVHLGRGQCADTERAKPHMSRNAELWELGSWLSVLCGTASPQTEGRGICIKTNREQYNFSIHCLTGGFEGQPGTIICISSERVCIYWYICTAHMLAFQARCFPLGRFFSLKLSAPLSFLLFFPACCWRRPGAGRCRGPPGLSGPRSPHCLLWERPKLRLERAADVYSFGEEVSSVTVGLVRLRTMAVLQLWSGALLPSEHL